MIRPFSNEMEKGFSRAMECKGAFSHEMDEAKNIEFFVSGRGQRMVISTFST